MGCESATTISAVVQDTLVLMKKPAIVCVCSTVRLVLKIRLQNGGQFRASEMLMKKMDAPLPGCFSGTLQRSPVM